MSKHLCNSLIFSKFAYTEAFSVQRSAFSVQRSAFSVQLYINFFIGKRHSSFFWKFPEEEGVLFCLFLWSLLIFIGYSVRCPKIKASYGVPCYALLLLNSFYIKIVTLLSLTASVGYDFSFFFFFIILIYSFIGIVPSLTAWSNTDFFMPFLQIILIHIADVYPRFEV